MSIEAGTVYIPIKPDMSRFGSSVTSGMSSGMSGVGSFITTWGTRLAATAGTAVVGALTGAIALGVSTAANMEQVQISLETLLGSGGEAKEMLGDLADFAAKTPFEFPELAATAQKLLALGFSAKEVEPMLTDMGNAASALSLGSEGMQRMSLIFGQIQAKGRLMAEDFMQLQEMGVMSWTDLADAMGMPVEKVQELVTAGKLGADEFFAAWEEKAGEFDGLMEKQSGTLLGMWSTLKDTVSMGLANMVKPFMPALKRALGGFTSWAADILGIGKKTGDNLEKNTKKSAEAMARSLKANADKGSRGIQTAIRDARVKTDQELLAMNHSFDKGGAKQEKSLSQAWENFQKFFKQTIVPALKEAWEAFGDWFVQAAGEVAEQAGRAMVNTLTSMLSNWWNSPANPFTNKGGADETNITDLVTGNARGGPVTGMVPTIVGEKGPELFVPNNSGRIIPNHVLMRGGEGDGSGGGPATITITNWQTGSGYMRRMGSGEVAVSEAHSESLERMDRG